MVPEYSKAALGLHPLIPLYAVDCDENRSLCAEQARLSASAVRINMADVSVGSEGLSDG
jgi:protein disulfide-isomerase A6